MTILLCPAGLPVAGTTYGMTGLFEMASVKYVVNQESGQEKAVMILVDSKNSGDWENCQLGDLTLAELFTG